MGDSWSIGLIPGDDVGGRLANEALRLIESLGFRIEKHFYDLGAAHYRLTGEVCSDQTLAALTTHDALFVGSPPASDGPDIPTGLLERGIIFRLRTGLNLNVNLRTFRGVGEFEAVNVAVVRENSEGGYMGEGGVLRKGTREEVATQGSVNTRYAVERCIRFAFDLARGRRGRVSLAHKVAVLQYSGSLWQRAFDEVANEYPDVTTNYQNVDICCSQLVENPEQFDVIVTDNVFGDIVSDVACAVAHAGHYSGSSELNTTRSGPSLFEPMHGAKVYLPGTGGELNPLPALAGAALLLENLGESHAASAVSGAVLDCARDFAQSPTSTAALTDRVIAAVGSP